MLGWFAETTLVAAGLAALAALACRSRRLGPEARHAVWLVVLIKLAMPPVVAWPRPSPEAGPAPAPPRTIPRPIPSTPTPPRPVELPEPAPIEPDDAPILDFPTDLDPMAEAESALELPADPPAPEEGLQIPKISDFRSGVEQPRPEPVTVARTPEARPADEKSDPTDRKPASHPGSARLKSEVPKSEILKTLRSTIPSLLLGLWLAGSAGVVVARGFAVARFRRSIRGASPAPGWVVAEARAIGERVGVRPPPILVAPGVATPMLWCLGRPRLILPASLVVRLDVERWSGVLAHELAHLARRDHWVVRLELLVEAAWWWNPLFHLARRRVRAEAERAADARVLRALPEGRFAYAEALVEICEHLARTAIPSPALGVGGPEATRTLETRLLMILRDPIPRAPGRKPLLAAGLLAALALPTWTLGQQPEPSPKPAPAEAAPKPDGSKPSPDPEPSPKPKADEPEASPVDPSPKPGKAPIPTIESIRAGFAKRLVAAESLGFRYTVASRDVSALSGSKESVRVQAALGARAESVRVQVADVLLGPRESSRLDVLSSPANPKPNGPGQEVRWLRQFVALDPSNLVTFRAASTQDGPIPFRWQMAGGRASTLGDDLAVELLVPSGNLAFADRTVDPLVPRPRNVLDLAGATRILLEPPGTGMARVEVAGSDTVEGREAVRVAWISYRSDGQGGGGLRGLLWVAPSLGFAVVRSEAALDASQPGMMTGRRLWRKTAGDFVEVDGLWLPRKVEGRVIGEAPRMMPTQVHEPAAYVASFEDYRVNPDLPEDAFDPKFPIEALDERTGDFTTKAPPPSPGLLERFRKAVAEPPLVPPGDREIPADARGPGGPGFGFGGGMGGGISGEDRELIRTNPRFRDAMIAYLRLARGEGNPDAEEVQEAKKQLDELRAKLKADPNLKTTPPPASPAGAVELPAPAAARPAPPEADAARRDPITLPPVADLVKKVDEAPVGRITPNVGQPGPPPDPNTVSQPAKADPAPAGASPDGDLIEEQVRRRFMQDPEVIALAERLVEAREKRDRLAKTSRIAGDPAERNAHEQLLKLQARYDRLWEIKDRQIREWLAHANQDRDELALLQALRDGKIADVRKAEAQRALAQAVVNRNAGLNKKGANLVSPEEVLKGEAQLGVAEAEVASRKADLAGVDIRLVQAKRRLGLATGSDVPPAAASPTPVGTLADLRDAAELMEVQLTGKRAEKAGASSRLKLMHREMERIEEERKTGTTLIPRAMDEKTAQLQAAELDFAVKDAELQEAQIRLKQAKRRVEAEEARLRRAADRAKSELDHTTELWKRGEATSADQEAARSRYDELMFQLDPKHTPTPAPPAPNLPTPPPA